MSTHILDHFALSKVMDLLFVRQTPRMGAERHKTLAQHFSDWRARRAAQAELEKLSDRDLADIGLTRAAIPQAVRVRREIRL